MKKRILAGGSEGDSTGPDKKPRFIRVVVPPRASGLMGPDSRSKQKKIIPAAGPGGPGGIFSRIFFFSGGAPGFSRAVNSNQNEGRAGGISGAGGLGGGTGRGCHGTFPGGRPFSAGIIFFGGGRRCGEGGDGAPVQPGLFNKKGSAKWGGRVGKGPNQFWQGSGGHRLGRWRDGGRKN